MEIKKKYIYMAVFVIIILFMIVWGFFPSPVPVTVEQVQKAPLEVTIEEEGITQVADRYTISAPVTGYLLRIENDVGDSINVGQELFQIQPVPDLISARQQEVAQSQLEAAKARLEQAKENLSLARDEKRMADTELRRVQNLFNSEIGSKQGVDNAEITARRAAARLTSAEFAVQVAEHEVNASRISLQAFHSPVSQQEISIESPVQGRLLKIYHKSEGTIQAGTPILEIGDPHSLEIKSELLSSDAVQIVKGTPVRIKRWGADNILVGTVKLVEPSGYTRISALGVEEQRVPVIVNIISPHNQWQQLGDGYRVVAEFILWEGNNVVQVPTSSLFRTAGEQWSLFVVLNGRAHLRNVDTGRQSRLQTQITGGVQVGDNIISHPDERIEEGVRVESRRSD